MKKLTIDEIEDQVDILENALKKKINAVEKATLEVRPAVSHGDIEIFMNGRLYWLNSDHFSKVLSGKTLDSLLVHILERLRGKRYIFTPMNPNYDLLMVQKEINYVLLTLIEEIISADEEKRLDSYIDSRIMETFNIEKLPKEFDVSIFKFINCILISELVKIFKKKKNG